MCAKNFSSTLSITTCQHITETKTTQVVTSKAVLAEFSQYLTAAITVQSLDRTRLSELSASITGGAIQKFDSCLISSAIQSLAIESAQQITATFVASLEIKLLEEQAEALGLPPPPRPDIDISILPPVLPPGLKGGPGPVIDSTTTNGDINIGVDGGDATKGGVTVGTVTDTGLVTQVQELTTQVQQIALQVSQISVSVNEINVQVNQITSNSTNITIGGETPQPPVVPEPIVDPVPPVPEPIVEPPPPEDNTKELDNFVGTQLGGFGALTGTAPADVDAVISELETKFNISHEDAKNAIRLSYYDFIMICDDSGSMTTETTRIPTLQSAVKGLFDVHETFKSGKKFSIRPFEGLEYDNVETAADAAADVEAIEFNTGASADEPTKTRALTKLEQKASKKALSPTVIAIITDGDVGNAEALADTISSFKQGIVSNGYTGPAVLFFICRVGSDTSADTSIIGLVNDPRVSDIVLYPTDQLDQKLNDLGGNQDWFAGWIITQITKAIDLQITPAAS